MLADGNSFPGSVGNGTVFAGYPNPDLKTGIETAGDLTQMSVQVGLVGTQFGVAPPNAPMPENISLVNDGWVCPKPSMQGRSLSLSRVSPKSLNILLTFEFRLDQSNVIQDYIFFY